MSDFLLVVEGLMADGSDAAMMVSESDYLAALFGHVFTPEDGRVLGYVWCDKHGWVGSDESRVCGTCEDEAVEAYLSQMVRCTGCGELVERQEPCSCVFTVNGTVDAHGRLHTPERVPSQWDGCDPSCEVHGCSAYECLCAWRAEAGLVLGIANIVPCYMCGTTFEPDPFVVDQWARSGQPFEPSEWLCPACWEAGIQAIDAAFRAAMKEQDEQMEEELYFFWLYSDDSDI